MLARFFQNQLAALVLVPDFADDFFQQIFHRDHAGRAAKFIHDHGQAAPLALQGEEEFKQIHALGDEGRELNRVRQIHVGVQQQRLRVQHAHDGVRRLVIHGQAAVTVLTRGFEHLFHRQVIRDAGHARTRRHDAGGGFFIEADDLENNFLLAHRQRALLGGQFEQFAIILLAADGHRFDGAGEDAMEEQTVDRLGEPLGGTRHALPPEQRPRDAQRPHFRRAHGQGLGHDFAAHEDEHPQTRHGQRDGIPAPDHHAETERDHDGVGQGVAENDGGEQLGRLLQQAGDNGSFVGGAFGELFQLPFAEREQGGLCEREKEARRSEHNHPQHDQVGREIHGGSNPHRPGRLKTKLETASGGARASRLPEEEGGTRSWVTRRSASGAIRWARWWGERTRAVLG